MLPGTHHKIRTATDASSRKPWEAEVAETRGFEPPVLGKKDNSLAVSPIRPLWHVSTSLLAQRLLSPYNRPYDGHKPALRLGCHP